KWALSSFWRHLKQAVGGGRAAAARDAIDAVVVKTLVAADGEMATRCQQMLQHPNSCYELFGFDVLLDAALKPWLLEVNVSPSLMGLSALDRRIKGTLMADVFHLVGFQPYDGTALRRKDHATARSTMVAATA
ncbi:unnamed protein product, partial [Phaeothamnion confervicola]